MQDKTKIQVGWHDNRKAYAVNIPGQGEVYLTPEDLDDINNQAELLDEKPATKEQ